VNLTQKHERMLVGDARFATGSLRGHERTAIRVQEFADRLGISVHCARHWAHSRKISSTKIGKLLFIPVGEIDRLIEENLKPALPI
jgi:excisionase family DNA binding protein